MRLKNLLSYRHSNYYPQLFSMNDTIVTIYTCFKHYTCTAWPRNTLKFQQKIITNSETVMIVGCSLITLKQWTFEGLRNTYGKQGGGCCFKLSPPLLNFQTTIAMSMKLGRDFTIITQNFQ